MKSCNIFENCSLRVNSFFSCSRNFMSLNLLFMDGKMWRQEVSQLGSKNTNSMLWFVHNFIPTTVKLEDKLSFIRICLPGLFF